MGCKAVLVAAALSVCLCTGQDMAINHEGCGIEKDGKEINVQVLMMHGSNVEPGKFPWHVGIFHDEAGNIKNICGGSLISMRIVVSAAHCFYDVTSYAALPSERFRVAAGSLLRTWHSCDPNRQESEVVEIYLKEKFAGIEKNFQEDIALLLLASQFTYSEMVRPVCLSLNDPSLYDNQVRAGNFGHVAGWGLTEVGEPSEVLKFLKIPIIADKNCTSMSRKLKHIAYMTSDKICAGFSNASTVCQGDSGGGLVFPWQGRYYLRGLVSNAPANTRSLLCAPDYALFTNIDSHKEWLRAKILNLTSDCKEMAEQVFPTPAQGGERCPVAGPSAPVEPFSNTLMTVAQIPHYVKLGKGNCSYIQWWCRGVLISKRWVLSTAKCVQQHGPMRFARTGGGTGRSFTPGDTYAISWQLVQPAYNSSYSLVYSDISLLQLQTPVTFSKTVYPACLPSREQLPAGLLFLGWSKELKGYAKNSMRLVRNDQCRNVFLTDKEYLPDGVRSATQVCARPTSAGKCRSYFSGSPLQAPNADVPCTQLLAGLSSASETNDCTRVFVRVATFVPWIEDIVWPRC